MIQNAEFEVYNTYARDIIQEPCRGMLSKLLARTDVYDALQSAGHGFREAVKYYLPKLLLTPVWHCFLYFDYVKVKLTFLVVVIDYYVHCLYSQIVPPGIAEILSLEGRQGDIRTGGRPLNTS